jgi:hypothetical protein
MANYYLIVKWQIAGGMVPLVQLAGIFQFPLPINV